jgi:hypothetical protein
MRRISEEEYKMTYGEDSYNRFDTMDSSRLGKKVKTPGVTSRVASDVGNDVSTMYSNIRQSGVDTRSKIGSIYDNVEAGTVTPGAGALQITGTGLRDGAEAVGEAGLGIGKAFLTPEAEAQFGRGAEKIGTNLASSEPVQTLLAKYNALSPEKKAVVDGTLGVAEGIGTMFALGPIIKAFKAGLNPVVDAAVDATGNALRTGVTVAGQGVDAVEAGMSKVGDTIRPAMDVASGLKQQTTDYMSRVATDAKDAAIRSRALRLLPEPEAAILRTGIDERGVKLVKESTPAERAVYRDLVAASKDKSGDLLAPEPKIVAGREFMKPVDHLLTTRDSVGKQLGEVRKTLTSAPIDVTPQFREFQKYLNESLGIFVDSKGQFVPGKGKVAQADLAELQKLYNELRPDNTGKVMRSQKWLDEWSQRTFKDYDLRQAREQTFGDDVTRTADRARGIFKTALPPEYQTLSTQYAEVMKPIQDVAKLLGYRGDISLLTGKELKAAEVALRVLGSASDRPQSVIDAVLETATKNGYTSDVDLKKVIIMADAMEDIYPDITPKRGFTGSTARGVNQSDALGAASDVASMNAGGMFRRVMSSTASQREIQSAFEAFLNSLD